MTDKLNSREAIYGFVGWLTSSGGKEKRCIGGDSDCGIWPDLIEEFCNENKFDEVSDEWPTNLVHPSGEVAKATCSHKWIVTTDENNFPEDIMCSKCSEVSIMVYESEK